MATLDDEADDPLLDEASDPLLDESDGFQSAWVETEIVMVTGAPVEC